MKNLYSRLALITSVVLITGYFIVSAVWVDMNSVGAGDQLSANLWNTLVENIKDLNVRTTSTASIWPTVTGGIAYTGGNVGIGTVSPGYPLDIVGLVNTQGALGGFRVAPRDGVGTSFSWYNPTGDDFRMYASAIGDLFTVQMNGNVGIGTTDPGGYRTAIRGINDVSGSGALWVSGLTAGTPGLMVRNDGNVGIGTATPGAKLHIFTAGSGISPSTSGDELVIENNGDAGLSILGGSANSSYMLFGDGGSSSAGIIQYYHTDPSLRLRAVEAGSYLTLSTANIERVRVDTGGNVGIGTASPNAKLQIESTTLTSPNYQPLLLTAPTTAIGNKLGITFSQTDNYSRARAGIYAISELANGY
ncbi:MAG: hypothetical protein Q8K26_04180, partial [Candidatus Gracilibacteria bacterium]|nr:hypothetical protein [Candidatus Gracilibacteria bacterium]